MEERWKAERAFTLYQNVVLVGECRIRLLSMLCGCVQCVCVFSLLFAIVSNSSM